MSLSNRTSAIQLCRCELRMCCVHACVCACACMRACLCMHACVPVRACLCVRSGGCVGVGACVPACAASLRLRTSLPPLQVGCVRVNINCMRTAIYSSCLWSLVTAVTAPRAAAPLRPPRLFSCMPWRGDWCRSVLCARKLRPLGSPRRCRRGRAAACMHAAAARAWRSRLHARACAYGTTASHDARAGAHWQAELVYLVGLGVVFPLAWRLNRSRGKETEISRTEYDSLASTYVSQLTISPPLRGFGSRTNRHDAMPIHRLGPQPEDDW